MGCHHPLRAFRNRSGVVTLGREPPDTETLALPCGGCLGCRETKAKHWALRCHLEFTRHDQTAFVTLTYNEEKKPPTLSKRALQLFHKRLRRRKTARAVRHFSCGEYGEQTGRPHYHTLLFGVGENEKDLIQAAWPHGHAYTVKATPGAINYVAGYTAKKLGDNRLAQEEQIDPETGEVFNFQPPFLQMSLKPGIGGEARRFTQSWRAYAVNNGITMTVPRYLHEAWKKTATPEQIEQLANEKYETMKNKMKTTQERKNEEQLAIAKQQDKARKRKY